MPPPQEGERNFIKTAAKVSDFLLLLHFVSDPYIYVLLRNHRQRNTFNVMLKKILNAKPSTNIDDQQNLSIENVIDCNTNLLVGASTTNDNNNIMTGNHQQHYNNNMGNSRRASVVCFSSSVIDNTSPAGQTRGSFQ